MSAPLSHGGAIRVNTPDLPSPSSSTHSLVSTNNPSNINSSSITSNAYSASTSNASVPSLSTALSNLSISTSTSSSSSTSAATSLKTVTLRADTDFVYPNHTSIETLLQASAQALGRNDYSLPLKVLKNDNWVETVGDLRAVIAEGFLREVGLPLRLCSWLEEQCGALANHTNQLTATYNSETNLPSIQLTPMPDPTIPIGTARAKADILTILRPQFDFDTNGVLYYLGTRGSTKEWCNPADLGLVSVTANGMMKDSEPPSAVCGRETVRCVTSSDEHAWMMVDLRDYVLKPTHYSLRHYSSYDTECVRDWKFEGSVDAVNWFCLKDHRNDVSISGKGSTATWPLSYDEVTQSCHVTGGLNVQTATLSPKHYYRYFRIWMTGPNSNNHLYLCCSGWEMYGSLMTRVAYQQFLAAYTASLSNMNGLHAHTNGHLLNIMNNNADSSSGHKEYIYQSDFDSNGIIHALSTSGGKHGWVNAHEHGILKVTASSLMDDSVSLSAVVGRDVVRCVTKAIPNSWMCVDFLDKTVQISSYTLRHYSSWDTECLRSWRVEGSIDGDRWSLLREHVQDESLVGKGATFTWHILDSAMTKTSFRYFRILQTGENSNKHHYLPCSGLELYGRLFQSDGVTPFTFDGITGPTPSPLARLASNISSSSSSSSSAAASATVAAALAAASGAITAIAQQVPNSRIYSYTSDFDQNGLIWSLATNDGKRAYTNPHADGLLRVIPSSQANDSVPFQAVVDTAVVRCVTKPEPDSWFVIDFLTRAIAPTAYTLRHYASWDTEALRNWRLLGSNDGVKWTLLREHKDDASLDRRGASSTWTIPLASQFYRLFKVIQFDKNSNKHHYLACSGFEIYGVVKKLESSEIASIPDLKPIPASVSSSVAASAASTPSAAGTLNIPNPVLSPNSSSSVNGAAAANGALAANGAAAALNPASVLQTQSTPAAPIIADSWDEQAHGNFILVEQGGSIARNSGSSDKWQMVRGTRSYSSGVCRVGVKIVSDTPTTNTWRYIIGVVPTTLDCKGTKQWVGTSNSWGFIAGTGGKCHNAAQSIPYGSKYGKDDVIGMILNFDAGTIEYYRNSEYQGVAFTDLTVPVHVACSLTATDAAVMLVPFADNGPAATPWDAQFKSANMVIDERTGFARNLGMNDKWQCIRSARSFSASDPDGPRHRFDIEMIDTPKTNNSWQVIVGVVPASFVCQGSKQWVGAGESWGYIGGLGGKCFGVPKSTPYGETFGKSGDIVTVILDFELNTIEFLKNGVSQGVAFNNLTPGPVYAAISLTAAGATAKLTIQPPPHPRPNQAPLPPAAAAANAIASTNVNSSSSVSSAVISSAAASSGSK